VRGVILTGAGDKASSQRRHLNELAQVPQSKPSSRARSARRSRSYRESRKPVIAAVNDLRSCGGCETAMSCHNSNSLRTQSSLNPK